MISDAFAQTTGGAAAGGGMEQIILMAAMFGALWFFMIRPQMKRAKEHKSLLDALAAGDEVVTQGGIAGKVVSVGESFVKIEIAAGVEVSVQKSAVGAVLPKGTLKNA